MIRASKYLFTSATLVACLLMGNATIAQESDEQTNSALARSYQAEHRAWMADVKRWRAEHQQAQELLQSILDQFGGTSQIEQHMSHIEEHGDYLGASSHDVGKMVEQHARRRAMNEEMREAHHHLMDTIKLLERSVEQPLGPAAPAGAQHKKE